MKKDPMERSREEGLFACSLSHLRSGNAFWPPLSAAPTKPIFALLFFGSFKFRHR